MKMFSNVLNWRLHGLSRKRRFPSTRAFALAGGLLLAAGAPADLFCFAARAQQTGPQQTNQKTPMVVQPGAPGQPSRKLPPSTTAKLPPRSQADVEFMQGMIMHHAQAVEMTALIPSHGENKELRLLAARISTSQSDEIKL